MLLRVPDGAPHGGATPLELIFGDTDEPLGVNTLPGDLNTFIVTGQHI